MQLALVNDMNESGVISENTLKGLAAYENPCSFSVPFAAKTSTDPEQRLLQYLHPYLSIY